MAQVKQCMYLKERDTKKGQQVRPFLHLVSLIVLCIIREDEK